ncbi:MAG: hypothetical protein ACMUJM_18655 [bacterium]
MFSRKSRYRKLPDIVTIDVKGRLLKSRTLRMVPDVPGDFYHIVEEVDRLDHLGYKYYKQPIKWWRICDANPQFMSPQALLGKEAIESYRFPLTFNDNSSQPPWSTLLKRLSQEIGIIGVKVNEDVKLILEEQIHDGEQVTVYAEHPERSVMVTYNRMNKNIADLVNIIKDAGFSVGQPQKIDRVGKNIIIPQNMV